MHYGRRHDLTETTRAMAKRGSEDLKKIASTATASVNLYPTLTFLSTESDAPASTQDLSSEDIT
jgi:hypothetical protein